MQVQEPGAGGVPVHGRTGAVGWQASPGVDGRRADGRADTGAGGTAAAASTAPPPLRLVRCSSNLITLQATLGTLTTLCSLCNLRIYLFSAVNIRIRQSAKSAKKTTRKTQLQAGEQLAQQETTAASRGEAASAGAPKGMPACCWCTRPSGQQLVKAAHHLRPHDAVPAFQLVHGIQTLQEMGRVQASGTRGR